MKLLSTSVITAFFVLATSWSLEYSTVPDQIAQTEVYVENGQYSMIHRVVNPHFQTEDVLMYYYFATYVRDHDSTFCAELIKYIKTKQSETLDRKVKKL